MWITCTEIHHLLNVIWINFSNNKIINSVVDKLLSCQ